MVIPEPAAPVLAQVRGQVVGGAGIAADYQVPARVADRLPGGGSGRKPERYLSPRSNWQHLR
jgi:hypothetical protein